MKNIIFVPDLAICISDVAVAAFFQSEHIRPIYGRVVPYAGGNLFRQAFGLVYFENEEDALEAFSRAHGVSILIYDPVTREFFH